MGKDLLDGRQGDHLAAQLDEALEAAGKDQHAQVLAHQIPGAVPGEALEGLEGGLHLRVEVAAEDARAAHQQHAGLPGLHPTALLQVHDGPLQGAQRPADAAGAGVVLPVHGDHRRALGDAVALQHHRAGPAPGQGGVDLLRALLRPGDHRAQGLQVTVLRLPQDAAEEGGRAHQEGGVVGLDEAGQHPPLGGVGVVHHPQAQEHRQDGGGGEAKGVKGGQAAHDPLVRAEADGLGHIPDVGQDVAVGEGDGLGQALAAAGEEHGGSLGRPGFLQLRPAELGLEGGNNFGDEGDLLPGFIQQEEAAADRPQVHALGIQAIDEGGDADDPLDPHQVQAEGHAAGPGGPVHQHRRLAGEEQGQVDDAGAARSRQHETDVGAL